MANSNQILSFRPIEEGDEALLRTIYSSTRAEEMELVSDWPSEVKTAFLQQQFNAQHTYYQMHFPQADFLIILIDGSPGGRLYIDRRSDTIHMIDITLLPEFRGKGYGEYLIRQLFDEAALTGKSVGIYVERQNRALHLYERMGFEVVDDSNQVYLLMNFKPA